MGTFYHATKKQYISSILNEGLKSPTYTGTQNTYYGVKGNPNFVYLNSLNGIRFVKKLISEGVYPKEFWNDNTVLLEAKLDDNVQIERDFDQVLLAMWNSKNENKAEFYKEYFKKLFGLDFDLDPTEENLVSFCREKISDELWDKRISCYRTRGPVKPDCIKIISLEDIVE